MLRNWLTYADCAALASSYEPSGKIYSFAFWPLSSCIVPIYTSRPSIVALWKLSIILYSSPLFVLILLVMSSVVALAGCSTNMPIYDDSVGVGVAVGAGVGLGVAVGFALPSVLALPLP